jgi:phenylacetic acid degradation protein PaaD
MSDIESVAERLNRLASADNFVSWMGVELGDVHAGHVQICITVRDDHLNFMGWAHGGLLFAFADTAFGLASNSHDHESVGIDAHIAYLSGVREGDVLIATATEVSRTKRKGVYRVDVTREGDDLLIATFTGTVFVTEKTWD